MKKIALVGCTGSIGRQTLSVVRRHPDKFSVCCLISGSASPALEADIAEFSPKTAAAVRGTPAAHGGNTHIFCGEDGALNAVEDSGADIVVVACGGFAGLKYSLLALKMGARLALANKETLVCGGDIIMPIGGEIVPIDSEHSAIWQCLNFNRRAPFKNLIITASGGPFRDKNFDELEGVTPDQALNHPTWKMGAKITIDSATLLNKGYEVIEAHHLYGADYASIKTVIQPQSIIHSMVEFEDGAIYAQLSNPTMELPIQLALTYPERYDCGLQPLDFTKAFSIDFIPLERKKYPMYDLALSCGEAGGVLPTALNAASEEAVGAYLSKKITFCDIWRVSREVVEGVPQAPAQSYEQLAAIDKAARIAAQKAISKRYNVT
ncbi:MAG TPA: 1-deoxy-D-xylulose-5-phosphate reductoisomerase [Candidatus Coproplasma excrementipullorum]|nr:1-deoxy-D-xylulose-5-phosphate reductoisomerase [Candidatus Coproplasma excrementipullorum]